MAEQQPSFDAAKYKNAQREQWNKDGAAWRRWNPTLDRWYGDVTRQMLDLARIQPGQRVLDIAAGAGEPAVSAAERVGPGGYVLATDISEGIVELALQVARERGLEQIETRAMDGEKLDLPDASFDAVVCRLGLMYMPHPVTALGEWRRALRSGGRVAVVVFSTPDRNSWGAMPACHHPSARATPASRSGATRTVQPRRSRGARRRLPPGRICRPRGSRRAGAPENGQCRRVRAGRPRSLRRIQRHDGSPVSSRTRVRVERSRRLDAQFRIAWWVRGSG